MKSIDFMRQNNQHDASFLPSSCGKFFSSAKEPKFKAHYIFPWIHKLTHITFTLCLPIKILNQIIHIKIQFPSKERQIREQLIRIIIKALIGRFR